MPTFTATVPVSVLAGTTMLQSMLDQFQIFSDDAHLPTAPFQMAVDDIVWDTGTDTDTDTDADSYTNPSAIADLQQHANQRGDPAVFE